MSKEKISIIIVSVNLVVGIVLAKVFHYLFWGGVLIGVCCTLLLFVTIGRWQAKKAAAMIDKRMRDHLIIKNSL